MLIKRIKQGIGLWLAVLCLIFVAAPGIAGAAPSWWGRDRGIDIVSPKRHAVLDSLPVAVAVELKSPIKKGSFKAKLNGHDVTKRFTVSSDKATASLTEKDGIRAGKKHRQANTLQVWATGSGRHSHSHKYHDHQTFFVKVSAAQNQVSGVITPAGGALEMAGIGRVVFPAGAFAADTTVTISTSQSPEVQTLFDQTAATLFGAANRLGYEIRISTGAVQPLLDPQVILFLPDAFRAAVPAGSEVRMFAENFWENTDEVHDTLDVLPERFTAGYTTVTASVPMYYFTNGIRADGAFELTVLAATTPTASVTPVAATNKSQTSAVLPAVTSGPDAQVQRQTVSQVVTMQANTCDGSTLAPPLDGSLNATSPFGMRQHPVTGTYQGHGGTDYAAPNGSTVRSMADGTVERVGNDTRTVNGRTVGWGNYVVVRHTDGSKTLYAHLEAGTPVAEGTQVQAGDRIADSDNSGGSTGPHLHIEYAPNGQIYDRASKVNPEPCIGGNVTGSITVSDNGTLADDAFSVAIDGLVVCTTSIGASNTCAVGNLRPGNKTLTINAVIAPDDAGTYQISLGNGLTFSGGGTTQSGVIAQGGSATYTVVVPAPSS